MVEVVYGGGNAAFDGSPIEKEEGRTAPWWTGAVEGTGGMARRGPRGEPRRGRKRGNQEKPKWVSGQVTWRRTGPTCRTATHCPTHPAAALGRSRFCLPIQETPRDTIVKMRCDPSFFVGIHPEERKSL
ncbi:unnamed protein product [Lasius platythorax]|uniref:Uncharacterized protein n=2 Tax=Lasius TaxID=488720 RepID=A0A0J7KT90_LASNI|nr:hypothetical protein RF55_6357 [Lasius niger]